MSQNLIFLTLPVPAASVGSLLAYAASLNGGSVPSGTAISHTGNSEIPVAPVQAANESSSNALNASSGTAAATLGESGDNAGKRDAAGTIFDPARHTGSIVKSGLWRMKAGLSRGPNEGEDSPTYVNPNGAGSAQASGSSASGTQGGNTTAQVVEEDEFAAFTAAAGQGSQTQARNWTDADLSKLCNQAAQAKNDPAPVKAIIAKYVPQGAQQHSKEIPADQREAFAKEVETSIGIQYAG